MLSLLKKSYQINVSAMMNGLNRALMFIYIVYEWFIQGWAEVSDRFSNRCGLKLVHATPIKFQTLDYQRVLCLFWKFEAFILKQNWFMIKNRIYFLFQKIEFSTLNFFKENQMFFNKKLLNFIQTEIFCVKLSFLNGQQIW